LKKKRFIEPSSPLVIDFYAWVAKLADAPDLGSGGVTRGGSTPPPRTIFFMELLRFEIMNYQL
jgi:hypothetical protein